MKKIIRLVIPLGLLAVLFLVIISFTRTAKASSNNSDIIAQISIPEQEGPPWIYPPAWTYRRAVIISNPGISLSYYQVLIKLDINNFDFGHAKPNGSDIRFTHADGTTELNFWIESWDSANHLAYVWVRVPSLAAGNNTIYLYYGNPGAISASDGNPTFDSFDDNWDQFTVEGLKTDVRSLAAYPGDEIYTPFVWSIISGTPTASGGILSLNDGTGIKSNTTYQYQAIGMRANYSLNSIDESIGFFVNEVDQKRWTIISDNKPGNINDLYLINSADGSVSEYIVLPKIGGQNWHADFHIYELGWKSGLTVADIDHGASGASSTNPDMVPSSSSPVVLFNDAVSTGDLLVDWVYVRQYRNPEPTSLVKEEQGLVELGIGITDTPDPVRKGIPFTYQLTISNTGSIDAPGVVVTDTLPASVQLLSITTSQGSCEPGSIILCDLNVINANSEAWVSLVVTATIEGGIKNNASVGSPGFELDLSDNSNEETTLIDWEVPVVIWERPVQNGSLYFAFGGSVTLEASATDNDQVARVEFRLWDHKNNVWISIGSDNSYPYQVQFDSSILAVNDPYQMFVVAVDRAGNQSNPYNPLQRIFIERKLPVYIPVIRK